MAWMRVISFLSDQTFSTSQYELKTKSKQKHPLNCLYNTWSEGNRLTLTPICFVELSSQKKLLFIEDFWKYQTISEKS